MGAVTVVVLAPVLWLGGALTFDGVHWILHRMLRSRFALLRALAWPHAVHHRWIDTALETHLELRRANVLCHIVPEYLTQLAWSGALALLLPLPLVGAVVVLQTGIFLGILSARGQDVNHRPAARIDAHPPGWTTPPAYHALHHAWPDAYFSAYTKTVDRLVGSGAQLSGRRFALAGQTPGTTELGDALARALRSAGGVPLRGADASADVLVLLDPDAALEAAVEGFVAATRDRRLPPEVWALRASERDALARHYRDDRRVAFRTLYAGREPVAPERAARRALFWIRRDAHFVPLDRPLAVAALWRFLRTEPTGPVGVAPARSRREFAAA